jgi:hypothetical protein
MTTPSSSSPKKLSRRRKNLLTSQKIRKVLRRSELTFDSLVISSHLPLPSPSAVRYKNLKNGVKSMEMSIDGLASLLEHVNNLLLMSDPILSAVAFAFAFFVASLASFFLCFISPNTLVFLMGLALFSPDEAVLRSKVLSKYYARKASRWLKKFIRSAKRAQILGFKGPAVLPGDYLHRLPLAATLSIMKQYELSGFLYSKTWPLSPAPSDESQRTVPAVDSWSSRWFVISSFYCGNILTLVPSL